MQLQRLEAGDEEKGCEIAAVFKESQISNDDMSVFLANRDNYLIAAYVDGELAGFVLGYAMRRVDRAQSMMQLYEIDVRPDRRRSGIGRALVDALVESCERQGFMKMWVGTGRSNTAAKALYTAAGGKMDGDDIPVGFTWHFGR